MMHKVGIYITKEVILVWLINQYVISVHTGCRWRASDRKLQMTSQYYAGATNVPVNIGTHQIPLISKYG